MTRSLLIFTILLSNLFSFSQWEQTNGPFGGGLVTDLETDSLGNIYSAVLYAGVFKSEDQGNTWTDISNGKFGNSVKDVIFTSNGVLFAADRGVLRSYDLGNSWERLENDLLGKPVESFSTNAEGEIFAAVATDFNDPEAISGLYKSTDNGDSWNMIYEDITQPENVVVAVNDSGHIFYGGWDLWKSIDSGASWINVTPPVPSYFKITTIAFGNAGMVFCGTYYSGGVYKSPDNGSTWELLIGWNDLTYVNEIMVDQDNEIFVSQYGLIFRSNDEGSSWDSIYPGFSYEVVSLLSLDGQNLIAGADGVHVSHDNGNNWEERTEGMIATQVKSVEITGTGKIFATDNMKLWQSTDLGDTWEDITAAFIGGWFENIKWVPTGLYVIADNGLYRSDDEGNSWTKIFDQDISFWSIHDYAINPQGHIFVVTWDEMWMSIDFGYSWQQVNINIDDFDAIGINNNGTIVAFGEYQYSQSNYSSEDNGQTWIPISGDMPYVNKVKSDSLGNFFIQNYSFIWRSTDDGVMWEDISPIEYANYQSLCVDYDGNVYTTNDTLILKSNDSGITWTDFFTSSAPFYKGFSCIASSPLVPYLVAGHPGQGVWRISNVTESVNNHYYSDQLVIYPNPADKNTTVRYLQDSQTTDQKIDLFTSTGSLIKSFQYNEPETQISLMGFNKGLYFIRVNSAIQKLIIK